jgi:hypothetical protein
MDFYLFQTFKWISRIILLIESIILGNESVMRKSWIAKTVVCGIICLLVGTNVVLGESENRNSFNSQSITQNKGTSLSASFTVIALPDTQNYASSYPDIFTNQTQWIVANREAFNIVYVAHEGDIVYTASSTTQWKRADTSMSYLEDPVTTGLPDGIPYSIMPGNHDVGLRFDLYFGVARFSGRNYYGGHFSNTNQNNYVLFDVGDLHYISISLSYNPDINVLHWTENILQTYSDRKAIIISHSILDNPTGDWTIPGLHIYNAVKEHPNVFLMLCGHNHYEARRSDTYNGHTIHTLLADYQDYPNGGDGWLRIMEIWPATNEIKVKTYSPYLNQYKTDHDSEFTLSYDEGEHQPPPTIIGPVKGTIGIVTNYNFTAVDPEGDEVYYFIDWGDDTISGWLGPYSSGEQITKSHTWSTKGSYIVKAKVKDIYGNESNWAAIPVTMPYSYNLPLMQFRIKLHERFSNGFPLLR